MTRKRDTSKRSEERALAEARRALSRGDLERAARAYERAARARERAGEDGFAHRLRSLDFHAAAGRHRRVVEACSAALRSARRRRAEERAELRVRRARGRLELGRARDAESDYRAAARLAPPDTPLAFEAQLGRARASLSSGSIASGCEALHEIGSRAERRGELRVASEAWYERGLLLASAGVPAQAHEDLEHASVLAETVGYRAGAFRASIAAAETALRLDLEDEALAAAEHARRFARSLRDGPALARAELAVASAEAVGVLREERRSGRPAAGSRRRIARRLRAARERWNTAEHGYAIACCRLLEARLAPRSSRAHARTAALAAERFFRARRLEAERLEARALAGELSAALVPPRGWRTLAGTAERAGALRLAAELYRRAAAAAESGAPPRGGRRNPRREPPFDPDVLDDLARSYALRRRSLERPEVSLALAVTSRPGEAAREIAGRLLAEGPEPKAPALSWTLAGRRTEQEALFASARRATAKTFSRASVRSAVLEALRRREPNRFASPRAARNAKPSVPTLRELEPGPLPRLGESEALVVFAARAAAVSAWIVRRGSVVSRVDAGTPESWSEGRRRLDAELAEARGWPDGAIPETAVRAAGLELARLGTELWSPLWPALRGVSQVWVVPDPLLPTLPHPGLVLAAEPRSWPRPRAVGHLADPLAARPRSWRLPGGRLLAIALRDPARGSYEREARAVARVLGGTSLPSAALALEKGGAPAALLRRLRGARLWHAAAPVYARAANSLWSTLALGADSFRLVGLARLPRALRLTVLPYVIEAPPDPSLFGRVVGSVGPEGAQPHPGGKSERLLEPPSDGVARALLALGAERVVLNAWQADEGATTGLLGSFYAGLARGDAPMESLFLAQRKAWSEGLHPIAWAGFACWGWR